MYILGVCYFIYYPVLSVGVSKGQLSGLVGMDISNIDVEQLYSSCASFEALLEHYFGIGLHAQITSEILMINTRVAKSL